MNPEEVLKLLDNGWRVLLFKDGLGSISALAVPKGKSVQAALREWRDYEEPNMEPRDVIFAGPNRRCGVGFTVAEALHSVTEKVIFSRLPKKEKTDTDSS